MKKFATGLAALGVVGLLAACGGADDTTASAGSKSASDTGAKCNADVTVANLAVSNAAAVVLGVQKGFFKDEGLNVTLRDTQAQSTQPAVVSGEAQFAFTNVPAVIAATSNGLPIRVVASAAAYPAKGDPPSIEVVAKAGSGITKPKDLEGKKIAVDTLYQLPHLSLIQAARAAGVDPSTFKISEVPYPAMQAAVESGQVDAADMGDPFLTNAVKAGFTEVLPNNQGLKDGAVQAVWVTSAQYLASDADVVACFQRAVKTSNEYAVAHLDEVRNALPTFTKVPAPLAAVIRMPDYSATLDKKPFEDYMTLMLENKVIKKEVDLKEVIPSS